MRVSGLASSAGGAGRGRGKGGGDCAALGARSLSALRVTGIDMGALVPQHPDHRVGVLPREPSDRDSFSDYRSLWRRGRKGQRQPAKRGGGLRATLGAGDAGGGRGWTGGREVRGELAPPGESPIIIPGGRLPGCNVPDLRDCQLIRVFGERSCTSVRARPATLGGQTYPGGGL